MNHVTVRRLTPNDVALGEALFQMMAEVFGQEAEELGIDAVTELLGHPHFWALAALQDGRVVGGITAHTLPMTSAAGSEILIYDVAVREEYRGRGVGRQLIRSLQEAGALAGAGQLWVLADNEDRHAVAFYRALGGNPAAVTMFTFPGLPRFPASQ